MTRNIGLGEVGVSLVLLVSKLMLLFSAKWIQDMLTRYFKVHWVEVYWCFWKEQSLRNRPRFSQTKAKVKRSNIFPTETELFVGKNQSNVWYCTKKGLKWPVTKTKLSEEKVNPISLGCLLQPKHISVRTNFVSLDHPGENLVKEKFKAFSWRFIDVFIYFVRWNQF